MKILFLCMANSARSQLAEGFARHLFPEAEIQSAGSHPGALNPYAIQVMKEIDIDISKHYSKSINELNPRFLADLNYVITLCAEEVCPIFLSSTSKKLHWPFKDPASKETLSEQESLQRFREVRDMIRTRILYFKKDIAQ